MPSLVARRSFLAGFQALAGLQETTGSRLAADHDRPRFHFLPPSGWMNDPNAPIFWNGEYHLFYQHNPKEAKWDTMHWGHATSPDLLHWRHKPVALAPTPGGPDKDGCFTGCMVIDGGRPTILYTGVRPEVQCLATSEDGIVWVKHPRNPVIAGPPPRVDTPGFRDPHVWRAGEKWLMLVGAGFRGVGGTALLYSSPDLVDWTYRKPLLTGKIDPAAKGGDVARGEMWECPDFFPVGGKWLFYVSTQNKVLYWLGSWGGEDFSPEQSGVLVHGAGYAPKSCAAPGNRRIIWAWLREQRSAAEQLKVGWSGVMSLAVVPSLARDGSLLLNPAAEYRLLRGRRERGGVHGDCCEVHAVVDESKPFSLARGGREIAAYDPASRMLSAGRSEAPAPPGRQDLRIFIDGSVVEIFAGGKVWLTGRVYGPSQGIVIGGEPRSIESWPLRPVSPDRLTGAGAP